ncbi:MAG: hypothetical protein V3T17_18110 [Pseudomonadales bacterium]
MSYTSQIQRKGKQGRTARTATRRLGQRRATSAPGHHARAPIVQAVQAKGNNIIQRVVPPKPSVYSGRPIPPLSEEERQEVEQGMEEFRKEMWNQLSIPDSVGENPFIRPLTTSTLSEGQEKRIHEGKKNHSENGYINFMLSKGFANLTPDAKLKIKNGRTVTIAEVKENFRKHEPYEPYEPPPDKHLIDKTLSTVVRVFERIGYDYGQGGQLGANIFSKYHAAGKRQNARDYGPVESEEDRERRKEFDLDPSNYSGQIKFGNHFIRVPPRNQE